MDLYKKIKIWRTEGEFNSHNSNENSPDSFSGSLVQKEKIKNISL